MKRGSALTLETVIVFILVAIAFLLVLGFVYYGDIFSSSKSDICHLSVIERASLRGGLQTIVPLQCVTEKVCLHDRRSEECSSFAGEKDVRDVFLTSDSVSAARAIEQTIADEMLACWKMMGEGKIDVFYSGVLAYYNLEKQSVGCLICSRLGFSFDDQNKESILGNVNIQRYLQETQAPGSRYTYLENFLGAGVKATVVPTEEILGAQGKALNGGESDDLKIVSFDRERDEMAVVFTQIHTDTSSDVAAKLIGLGATAGGAVLFTPVRRVATKFILTLPGAIVAGSAVAGVTLYTLHEAYKGRAAAASYCGPFVSDSTKSSAGCSVVQVVPYDRGTINQLCGYIEGAP